MDYPADSQVPRLLLVDYDSPEKCEMQEVLSVSGFGITLARDGYHAIETMQRQDRAYDLIIAEWYLPVLNGSAFAEIVHGSNNAEALHHISLFKGSLIYYAGFVEKHGRTPFLFVSRKPIPENADGIPCFAKDPLATRRPFFDEKGIIELVRDVTRRE